MKDFIVVKGGAEGIYEEKKSRFIAKVYKTDNESEAGSYIEEARKKYWDARHNCYAYEIIMRLPDAVMTENHQVQRGNLYLK